MKKTVIIIAVVVLAVLLAANAFYTVTTDSANTGTDYVATPREELMDKVLYINAEINYKREEFDLPLAQDTAENN